MKDEEEELITTTQNVANQPICIQYDFTQYIDLRVCVCGPEHANAVPLVLLLYGQDGCLSFSLFQLLLAMYIYIFTHTTDYCYYSFILRCDEDTSSVWASLVVVVVNYVTLAKTYKECDDNILAIMFL